MIDRRAFLKGVVGAGLAFNVQSLPKLELNPYAREEYLAGLVCPSISVLVKVYEVAVYPHTGEYDVCGICMINFESVPVEARYFYGPNSLDDSKHFKPGSMYVMTGALYLYEDLWGIHMISPDYKEIESLLNPLEIEEVKRWFEQ